MKVAVISDIHGNVAALLVEKAFIDANIGKLITLDPTPVTGEALEKVFHATFYMVKANMGNSGVMNMLVVARSGDHVSDVSLPGATADMPALKTLVKPDFKLKADVDGKAFEAALDLLYPPDTRYDEKRKAEKHGDHMDIHPRDVHWRLQGTGGDHRRRRDNHEHPVFAGNQVVQSAIKA